MVKLNPQKIVEYFTRSYRAVDGLWFLKVEEKYGFDAALELDNEVWKVIAKIQARTIKSFLDMGNISNSLYESIVKKLNLEDFNFSTERTDNSFRVIINDCPWHNLMIKSGREHLSGIIGEKICSTEYQVWVSEFDEKAKFELKSQKCKKSKNCVFVFAYN